MLNRHMSKIFIVGFFALVLLGIGVGGYRLGVANERKHWQSLAFPISPISLEYALEVVNRSGRTLTHYVPAEKKNVLERYVREATPDRNELISAFVVDGYLPEQAKLNLVYVTPKLVEEEIRALVNAGQRN